MTPTASMYTRSRWIDWKPKPPILAETAPILAETPESEPTKPTKPPSGTRSFVGFVGSTSGHSPKIEAGPDPASGQAKLTLASGVLARAGVRLMQLETGFTVGVWSDLDSAELRAAIRVFHPDGPPPIRNLDGPGMPDKFKARRVAGEPVPMKVLAEMERNPEEPWTARDRMLKEMNWCPGGERRQVRKGTGRA